MRKLFSMLVLGFGLGTLFLSITKTYAGPEEAPQTLVIDSVPHEER